MAAVKKIAEAMKSIPVKKENLRESMEVLRSYSSLASFNLEWKDLENHFSAIEKSIDERFKALEAKEEKLLLLGKSNNTSTTNKNDKFAIFRKEKEEEEESSPRPDLESICVRMDGEGLAAFMEKMRAEDINIIKKELAPALRLASDPAQLVLSAVGSHSNPPNSNWRNNRRNCITLLEKLQLVAPEIGPTVREKALARAAEWKSKISFDKDRDHAWEVIPFLQLIASFGIVAEFDHEEVLELFCSISRRSEKEAMVLVKNLDLINNLPEIIQKLSSKGRHLHAVKVIYAYDMAEKVPPVPLLEAYVKESRRISEEIQKRGKNSRQILNEAIAKEMGALKSVVKAIEDYKLENEYPCQDLEKRMSELEQQKSNKKRDDAGASVSISRKQQQEQSSKRSRQLASAPVNAMPGNPYPPSIQNHTRYDLADRAFSYMTGPYGLTASGSVYNHVVPSLSGTLIGHSGLTRSPPRPYVYSAEAFAGPNSLYDRPVTYSGYPPSYGSSLYP